MRFSISYNWYRVMGITTLFLIVYIVVIGIFGDVDISGLLPIKLAENIQEVWSHMPFFDVEKEPTPDGKGQVIYYTVPTRQFSKAEIARMTPSTNKMVRPAAPKPATSAAR